MNFMSSRAAKEAADEMKMIREDLTIETQEGAAFPSELWCAKNVLKLS